MQSMGFQRVVHDLVTEQQWQKFVSLRISKLVYVWTSKLVYMHDYLTNIYYGYVSWKMLDYKILKDAFMVLGFKKSIIYYNN